MSPWNKLQPEVPIHKKTGNMISYPDFETEMQRVCDFKAEMKLVDWERGRSSVTFIVEDVGGRRYPVFVSDFYWIARNRRIDNGVIEKTWWTFSKQGQNYGLRLR